jgi:hypothetical protein
MVPWWSAGNDNRMRSLKAKSIQQRLTVYKRLKKESLQTVMSHRQLCPASRKSIWASLEVYEMLIAQLHAELEQLEKTL